MANKTGWTGGRLNSGLGWTAGFGTETNSLVNLGAVLSSVAPFTNGTGLDQLVDLSLVATAAAVYSPAAGAGVNVWLAMLSADGTTYGDGRMTTTPSTTYVPPWFGFTWFPCGIGTSLATAVPIVSTVAGLAIPPGSFKLIVQNLLGFTVSALQVSLRSYDQDLNA